MRLLGIDVIGSTNWTYGVEFCWEFWPGIVVLNQTYRQPIVIMFLWAGGVLDRPSPDVTVREVPDKNVCGDCHFAPLPRPSNLPCQVMSEFVISQLVSCPLVPAQLPAQELSLLGIQT